MPITSVPANDRRERFVASAGQTIFPFDFPIYAPGDLAVRRLRAGVEATLALGTDYSLTGAGEQAGGTVTLTAGSLVNDVVTLASAQAAGRQAQFVNGGSLPAASLEAEFNRLEIAMQQLRDQLSRAVRLAETDASTPVLPVASARANRILAFDAEGSPIATSVAVGSTVVTPFMQTVLDDTTAAQARTTLDVPSNADLSTKAPIPNTSGVGSWIYISAASASPLVLPAGGFWAWFFISINTITGGLGGVYNAGISPGGNTIASGVSNTAYVGFAYRTQ